jgi:hypothetical protein
VSVACLTVDIVHFSLHPSKFLLLIWYRAAYNFTPVQPEDWICAEPGREKTNMNQIMYDLTYWFDFVLLAVSHHPLISVATVLVAFLFYQALGVMKVIGTVISFGLAVATALLLGMLM